MPGTTNQHWPEPYELKSLNIVGDQRILWKFERVNKSLAKSRIEIVERINDWQGNKEIVPGKESGFHLIVTL